MGPCRLWTATAGVLAAACLATGGLAQTYPAKTVRVIIPTGPAGGSDMQGRLMCKRLTETTGQSFFADNRPGASGMIGAELVAKGTADGGAGSARFGAWMRPGSGLWRAG
jgi:tripartite-type tricarboxylate transporter receptor subunit TctC